MKDHFVNTFQYDSWANLEIATCLSEMNSPPQKAVSLMSHIINAGNIWLGRLLNKDIGIKVWEEYESSMLPALAAKSSEEIIKYLESIEVDDLNKVITYSNSKGEKFENLLTDILIHLSHHSPYHRGQIVSIIKPLVEELPYTDYIHYVRNIKSEN